jgi:NADH-quinone oxidoreductase subunit N
LSVFSSALLLFGFSYLYGLSGTTNLQGIADALSPRVGDEAIPGMALVAIVMVVAGLGFKITAVPFHFYAPDVYQGTSTGAAALLAFIPKLAGFAALIRVLGFSPYELIEVQGTMKEVVTSGPRPMLYSQVSTLLWIVAAVTMTLGNVLALLQDNVKRLLAYSSVAHAGYMLIGLSVAPYLMGRTIPGGQSTVGTDAVLFYLVSYGAMTIGAFAVLEYLSTRDRPVETIDDLAGLSKSHPGVALLMALFMFSLIGLPATAGFIGKFLLFVGAFSVPYAPGVEGLGDQAYLFRILALIGVLNAAIGGWYYLRIIAVMYLRTPLQPLAKPPVAPRLVAVWVCAAVTLLFGLYPRPLVERTQKAIVNEVQLPSSPKAMGNAPPER